MPRRLWNRRARGARRRLYQTRQQRPFREMVRIGPNKVHRDARLARGRSEKPPRWERRRDHLERPVYQVQGSRLVP